MRPLWEVCKGRFHPLAHPPVSGALHPVCVHLSGYDLVHRLFRTASLRIKTYVQCCLPLSKTSVCILVGWTKTFCAYKDAQGLDTLEGIEAYGSPNGSGESKPNEHQSANMLRRAHQERELSGMSALHPETRTAYNDIRYFFKHELSALARRRGRTNGWPTSE